MFQHQVVSGMFWWAGQYLGWVGHFYVLQFENGSRWGWGPEKRPFIALCSRDPKKDPSSLPGPSPKDPWVHCCTRPWITMHRWLAPGTCWAQNTLSFILIFPHTFMYGLACLWAAVNILSRYIIHMLHLMQYLIHVLCTTNVCITAYKCFSAYSW